MKSILSGALVSFLLFLSACSGKSTTDSSIDGANNDSVQKDLVTADSQPDTTSSDAVIVDTLPDTVLDVSADVVPDHQIADQSIADVALDQATQDQAIQDQTIHDTVIPDAGLTVVGTWQSTHFNSRPPARDGHGIVVVNGTPHIFGGQGGAQTFFNDLWTYDPVADIYKQLSGSGAVPTPRRDFGMAAYVDAVTSQDKIVVWGGEQTNTGAIYDVATKTWTAMSTQDAPTARAFPIVDYVGSNELFVWGGGETFALVNTGAIYNASTNTWRSVSTNNAPINRTRMVWATDATARKVYAFGGAGGSNSFFNDLYVYDVASNTWSVLNNTGAPSGRELGTMVLRSGKLFVWGGQGVNGMTNTGGIYDVTNNSWSPTSSTSAPSFRIEFVTVNATEGIVVWAGNSTQGIRNDGALFKIETNTWIPLSTKLGFGTVEGVNRGKGVDSGVIFMFGGRRNTWVNHGYRLSLP